jgi:hypothetical protein
MRIGTRVWFPCEWNVGTLDSILKDSNGRVIAYVLLLDNGKKQCVDMQVAEPFDEPL